MLFVLKYGLVDVIIADEWGNNPHNKNKEVNER